MIEKIELEVSCLFCNRKSSVAKLDNGYYHCSVCSRMFEDIFPCGFCLNDKRRKQKCTKCCGLGKVSAPHLATNDVESYPYVEKI